MTTFIRIGVAILVLGALAGGGEVGSAAGISVVSQRLAPYRTCLLSATPSTTTSVVDASVRQDAAGTNLGTATTAQVTSAASANRRLYIRFDLAACSPTIPATAVVRQATLRLYASAVPAACRTLDLFRVASTWSEAGITWTNQPFGTAINNPTAASAVATVTVGAPAGCQNRVAGYLTGVTLTASVATFVAGGATNFGWMIRDDVEGSATSQTVTVSAKELNTIGQVPQLVITYVLVP
jgi:hypothetical protein